LTMAPFLNWFTAAAFVSSSSSSSSSLSSSLLPSSRNSNKLNDDSKKGWAAKKCTDSTITSSNRNPNQEEINYEGDLSQLISLLGGSPSRLLRLSTTPAGIRGVYLNEDVQQSEIILQIPLSSCLRDDKPPLWLQQHQEQLDDDDDNNNNNAVQIQDWVTRLAASLLEAQNNINQLPKGIQEWLHLLPTNTSLRESLPIYWSESILQSIECRNLELAVDSARFVRAAGPISDLSAANTCNMTKGEIEYALDLVQTRACRCSTVNDDESVSKLSVLVPVFDLMNHNYEPNAEICRRGGSMIVSALRNIDADEEVLIHYGSSTIPVWKCLFSYGFIPSIDDVYEHNMAEIIIDDRYRFEISPMEIPFELIQYQAKKLRHKDGENIELTSEIGHAIVDQLETSIETLEKAMVDTSDDKNIHSESLSLSFQLGNNLRESHRRTLITCLYGLKEYIEEQQHDS